MPFVKWREGTRDLTPDNELPIGKNVLELKNIRDTSNYTCVAASKLGIIETHTIVKVQGKRKFVWTLLPPVSMSASLLIQQLNNMNIEYPKF